MEHLKEAVPSVYARLLRAFLPFTALTVCVVTWLVHAVGLYQDASSAALVAVFLAVAALLPVSLLCTRIARLVGGDLERAGQELRQAEQRSRSSAAQLQALNVALEQRVAERTAALAESRDHLDQFLTITTALQDPDGAEKTFDLVLRFCRWLGYEYISPPAGKSRRKK